MVHPALNAKLQLMKPISERSEVALHGADHGLQGLLARLKWYIKAMCTGLTNPARRKLSLPTPHSQDVVSPLLKQDSKSVMQSHQFVLAAKKAVHTAQSAEKRMLTQSTPEQTAYSHSRDDATS